MPDFFSRFYYISLNLKQGNFWEKFIEKLGFFNVKFV